jgi:hypothetical protein
MGLCGWQVSFPPLSSYCTDHSQLSQDLSSSERDWLVWHLMKIWPSLIILCILCFYKCWYFTKNKLSRLTYFMWQFYIVIASTAYVLGTKNRQFLWKMDPLLISKFVTNALVPINQEHQDCTVHIQTHNCSICWMPRTFTEPNLFVFALCTKRYKRMHTQRSHLSNQLCGVIW